MVKEQKNKFWLTLVLILTLSFSALAAGVFVSNKQSATKTVSAATELETDNKQPELSTYESEPLVINYGEDSVLSSKGLDTNDDGHVTWDKNPTAGEIKGGSTISINSSMQIVITPESGTPTTYTPTPHAGYYISGFKVKGTGSEFGSGKVYTSAGEIGTTEDIDPEYDGTIEITALCTEYEYNFYLMYSPNGTDWWAINQKFHVSDYTDLVSTAQFEENLNKISSSIKEQLNEDGRVFAGSWLVKSYDKDTGKVIVSKDTKEDGCIKLNAISGVGNYSSFTGELKFKLKDGKNTVEITDPVNGDKYYEVTAIKGYTNSNFTGTPKSNNSNVIDLYEGTFGTSSFEPFVRAKWSYKYNAIVDLGAAKSTLDEYALNAVKSSEEPNNADTQATIKIAKSPNYEYQFFNNKGDAFLDCTKPGDYGKVFAKGTSSNWYQIYNNGYEITEWQIKISVNSSNYYVQDDLKTISTTSNNIEFGVNETTSDLIEGLDAFFVGGYSGVSVVMNPVWSIVEVDVHLDEEFCSGNSTRLTDVPFDYKSSYTINDTMSRETVSGKSVAYYTTKTGKIVVDNSFTNDGIAHPSKIDWNYYTMTMEDYEYNTVDSNYKIVVKPVFADMIYKLKLDGTGEGYFEYGDYEIASKGYWEEKYDIVDTHSMGVSGYTKFDYKKSSNKLAEDVKANLELYNTIIQDGTHPLLGKVFTHSFAFDHIYLVNGQTFTMPTIKREYYNLILWENDSLCDEKCIYTTSLYNDSEHSSEVEGKTPKTIWEYADMYSAEEADYLMTLYPNFFRKNYSLDISTLNEKGVEGQYGYVKVEITDPIDDKEGTFLVVFNEGKMCIYDASSLSELTDAYGKYIINNALTANHYLIKEDVDGLYLRLYAGCQLKITASVIDYMVEAFHEMIGYRLDSLTTTVDLFNSNDVDINPGENSTVTVEAEAIEDKKYINGQKLQINANFVPIKYNIMVGIGSIDEDGKFIENPYSGTVKSGIMATTKSSATITLENLMVEGKKTILIEYLADAGYTLNSEAFTMKNKDCDRNNVLKYYSTEQFYSFTFDGLWLLNYYYLSDSTTYYVDEVQEMNESDGGPIIVHTELLEYDVTLTVVDKKDSSTTVLNTIEIGTVKLNGKTDQSNIAIITLNEDYDNQVNEDYDNQVFEGMTDSIIKQVLTLYNNAIYVYEYDGNYYAVLSSVISNISDSRNYKITYNFPLSGFTGNIEAITQERYNFMFGTGEIAKDKILDIKLTVSELFTINLTEGSVTKDGKILPNPNGERSVEIKNHVGSNGQYSNVVAYNFKSTATGEKIVYSYYGLTNYVTLDYDTTRYQDAYYELDGSAVADLKSFTISGDKYTSTTINMVVYYVPRPITTLDIVYNLPEGVNKTQVLEETLPSNLELYFNETATYICSLKDVDYTIISILLNGNSQEIKDGQQIVLLTATDEVFSFGRFELVINIAEVEKDVVTFNLVVESNGLATDQTGDLKVLVDNVDKNVTKNAQGVYQVRVAAGRSVAVDLSGINSGYSFSKITKSGTDLGATLTNKKYTVIPSFEIEEGVTHSYTVFLKKDVVKVALTSAGEYASSYAMDVDGKKLKSHNSYIGDEISFTIVDELKEKLDYYYYKDKTGAEHKIEAVYNDTLGRDEIKLKITPELISGLNNSVVDSNIVWDLRIGVKTINKYQLTYKIVNAKNIESVSFVVYDENKLLEEYSKYTSGIYMLNGTKLLFSLTTKDYVAGNAKYDIVLSGSINETITDGLIENREIVLDEDKTLTITVVEKVFDFAEENYKEYIYNTITQIETKQPTALAREEYVGGFDKPSSLKYNSTATITINRVADVGELRTIHLSGNDGKELIIYLDGTVVISVYNVTDNVEYLINANNSQYADDLTVNKVAVTSLINTLLDLGYKFTVEIGSPDVIVIKYIVKNTIYVENQYVSYKYISGIK